MNEVDTETVRAIEAIVMVAVEPVAPDLLAQLLEQPTAVIERLCAELSAAYDEAGHGFQMVKVAGGYRYQSHADLAPYVERFLLDGQRARMSGAALETLAIVAYKQPLSRAQIASIRGVDPDGVLRTLQARGYITEVARDSKVTIIVSTGLPTIPDVSKQSVQDAAAQLQAAGFHVTGVQGDPFKTVTGTTPPAGTRAPSGTGVVIITRN